MRKYRFLEVDVFTKKRFGGNQLAVYVDGQSINDDTMQQIAQEMNFSETTFVLPSDSTEADWKVRIFTPTRELPFAGHPTLGTAYVLAQEGMIDLKEPHTDINLELGVGIIPVKLEVSNKIIGFIQMGQPLPTFGPTYDNIGKVAEALSIDVHEIEATGLPVEVVSCGLPYLIVPINSLHAIETMKPSLSLIEEIHAEIGRVGIFVFSKELLPSIPQGQEDSDLHVQSRMFFMGHGLREDPATGSANGPLGCYLAKNGVVEPKPNIKIISEQAYQMKRPSTVYIDIGMDRNEIVDVRVGGHVVSVAEGTLFVD